MVLKDGYIYTILVPKILKIKRQLHDYEKPKAALKKFHIHNEILWTNKKPPVFDIERYIIK